MMEKVSSRGRSIPGSTSCSSVWKLSLSPASLCSVISRYGNLLSNSSHISETALSLADSGLRLLCNS